MDLGGQQFNSKFYRGDEQDLKEATLFKEKYEQHKTDYIENGPKFGGQIPFMIANEEDEDYSHMHVGSKRSGGYHFDEDFHGSQIQKGIQSRARQENSLGELTRKFIMLIRDSKEHLCVDLNDAAV